MNILNSSSNKELYAPLRAQMIDKMFRQRRNSLFWETRYANDVLKPIFTLKDEDIVRDGVHYLSLKKIYLSYDHIPKYEYEFALDVFGSWEHWVMLSTEAQVAPHIQQWQEELEVRLKAEAIRNLLKTSRGDSNSAGQANKYIADRGWEVKAGRPSKEEKQRQLKVDNKVRETLNEDMERLGISVIAGAKG